MRCRPSHARGAHQRDIQRWDTPQTKIGKNCLFGGQVGVNWHLHIGDNVQVGAQSAISHNVPDNAVLLGTPAFNAKDCVKSLTMFKYFPAYASRISELEAEVKQLKKLLEKDEEK